MENKRANTTPLAWGVRFLIHTHTHFYSLGGCACAYLHGTGLKRRIITTLGLCGDDSGSFVGADNQSVCYEFRE